MSIVAAGGVLTGIKAAVASWKVWLSASLAVSLFLAGYFQGRDAANKDSVERLEAFVKEERERSIEDIVAVVAATRLIEVVKETGREQIKEMEALAADGGPDNCIPTDDELRLLREIAGGAPKGEGVLPRGGSPKSQDP